MSNTSFSKKSLLVFGGIITSFFVVAGLSTGVLFAASVVPYGSIDCGSTPPSTPCAVNQGQSCTSRANACGATGQGSISCDGTCSASVPALPSNLNQTCTSGANSCGQTNSGTITCSGTCSATAPADSSCPSYSWSTGDWGTCASSVKSRTIFCKDKGGATVADSYCNSATKPASSQACSCTMYYGVGYPEPYDYMHQSGPEDVSITFTVPAGASPVGMQTVLGGVMQTCDKAPYNDAIGLPYNKYYGTCRLQVLQTINQDTAPGGNPRMKITNTGTGQVVLDRTVSQWLAFPSSDVDFQETWEYLNLPQGTYRVDMYSTTLGYIYTTYSEGWVDMGNQYGGYWWQGSGNLVQVCS